MASPLFVSRFGGGQPMLCLHGIEAHGLRYLGLASHLDGVGIVAPDLRGHARSPRTGPFSLDQHVEDILPILRDLGPQTTLLGHSYGGHIAWEVARAAPDALARLVLVDPAMELRWDFVRQYMETAPSRLRWPDRTAAFRDLVINRQRSAYWSVALDVAVGMDESEVDGVVRVAVAEEALTACMEQLMHPIKESLWRGPTLLVEAGQEHAEFVTPPAIASLRRQLGDHLTHVVVDLPHTIPSDGPDVLADQVRHFMSL